MKMGGRRCMENRIRSHDLGTKGTNMRGKRLVGEGSEGI